MSDLANQSDVAHMLGQRGSVNISPAGEDEASGDFYALQILEDGTTFSTLTEEGADGDSLAGVALDRQVLGGRFTAAVITAGRARFYKV